MSARSRSVVIARGLVVLAPACLGWLLHRAAQWLISHDSIEYRLHDAGFSALTNLAEFSFAIGVVPSALGGLVLGLPAAVGFVLDLRWNRRVAIVNAAACLALVLGLGSVSLWAMGILLSISVLLWLLAVSLMLVCVCQPAQPGAPPNVGPVPRLGKSGVTEGPPSVS